MTTERDMAEAFAPCTIDGLPAEWDRMNREISAIRKERDALAAILLSASVQGADMAVDPAFRKGSVLGDAVKVQAVWHLDNDGRKWHPELKYVKEERND